MAKRSDYILGGVIVLSLLLFLVIVTYMFWTVASRGGLALAPSGNRVALIELLGPINASENIVRQLKKYKENDSIPAIVLRINSPGGSVASTQEMYREIKRVRAVGKKVVVSMASVAASGGYYVACAADTIVANPGTLTGSIGVILEFPNTEELFKKIGIRFEVVKSGKYKDIGSPMRKMTKEERKLLQELIDDTYNQFVDVVAADRGLDRQAVLDLADGRVFTGRQGQDYGLIDVLGDYEEAIALAAEMAGIEGKPKTVREWRKRITLWDLLLQKLGGTGHQSYLMPSLEYRFQ
ncbi:MAG: signal peptide peptidase SppA [bacterium]